MYCPKCGAENAEDPQLCSACGEALTAQLAVPAANAKTSKVAIRMLVLGILSFFVLFLAYVGFEPGIMGVFIGVITIIVGIVALVEIGKSSGKLKGNGLVIIGMVPAIALVILFVLTSIPQFSRGHRYRLVRRVVCTTNMRCLAMETIIYANDSDGKLPTADKWCDLLIEKADMIYEKSFCCPEQARGSFSYALNKNITSIDVALDTVLFFESDGGKNAAGGPEMLATERHRGEGCNFAFVDGRVEFVRTEDIGSLKWVPETTKDN